MPSDNNCITRFPVTDFGQVVNAWWTFWIYDFVFLNNCFFPPNAHVIDFSNLLDLLTGSHFLFLLRLAAVLPFSDDGADHHKQT